MLRLGGLLLPQHGAVAFCFASGKALRVLAPYLMLLVFAGSFSMSLAMQPSFGWLLDLQVLGYTLSKFIGIKVVAEVEPFDDPPRDPIAAREDRDPIRPLAPRTTRKLVGDVPGLVSEQRRQVVLIGVQKIRG